MEARKFNYSRESSEEINSKALLELRVLCNLLGAEMHSFDAIKEGTALNPEIISHLIRIHPLFERYNSRHLLYNTLKRVIDLSVLAILSPIWIPLFVSVFFLQLLAAGRPIFYKQPRLGLFLQPFTILKFRTLRTDTPILKEGHALGEKISTDKYYTPIGRFLRNYRLDELPQLLNTLRGEMSLVGPRPLPLVENLSVSKRQMVRYASKPGATGLWQSQRSTFIPLNEKLKLDAIYAKKASLLLDITILFKTLPVILRKESKNIDRKRLRPKVSKNLANRKKVL